MKKIVKRFKDSLDSGIGVYYYRAISEKGSSFLVSMAGTLLEGTLPSDFVFSEEHLHHIVNFSGEEYFCDAPERDPSVLVLGAGFVSRSVTDLLLSIGCDVTVADDREEYLVPSYFDARVVRKCIHFEQLDVLPLASYTGIIVVTRAHEYDSISLRQLRKYLNRYIGIMGSSKRIFYAKKQLLEEGWTKEEIDSLYAPIGLAIGAQTPEEIALSIVSEYLAVVRKKYPVRSLSEQAKKEVF